MLVGLAAVLIGLFASGALTALGVFRFIDGVDPLGRGPFFKGMAPLLHQGQFRHGMVQCALVPCRAVPRCLHLLRCTCTHARTLVASCRSSKPVLADGCWSVVCCALTG